MVKILGTGSTVDGQDYVMVSKSDFEELQSAKLLLDFAKQHSKEKEVLAKSKHPKGVSDEDENYFYKLRDWTKVSY